MVVHDGTQVTARSIIATAERPKNIHDILTHVCSVFLNIQCCVCIMCKQTSGVCNLNVACVSCVNKPVVYVMQ